MPGDFGEFTVNIGLGINFLAGGTLSLNSNDTLSYMIQYMIKCWYPDNCVHFFLRVPPKSHQALHFTNPQTLFCKHCATQIPLDTTTECMCRLAAIET